MTPAPPSQEEKAPMIDSVALTLTFLSLVAGLGWIIAVLEFDRRRDAERQADAWRKRWEDTRG